MIWCQWCGPGQKGGAWSSLHWVGMVSVVRTRLNGSCLAWFALGWRCACGATPGQTVVVLSGLHQVHLVPVAQARPVVGVMKDDGLSVEAARHCWGAKNNICPPHCSSMFHLDKFLSSFLDILRIHQGFAITTICTYVVVWVSLQQG